MEPKDQQWKIEWWLQQALKSMVDSINTKEKDEIKNAIEQELEEVNKVLRCCGVDGETP